MIDLQKHKLRIWIRIELICGGKLRRWEGTEDPFPYKNGVSELSIGSSELKLGSVQVEQNDHSMSGYRYI